MPTYIVELPSEKATVVVQHECKTTPNQSPAHERVEYAMNVRFTPDVKRALEQLARSEDRSQQRILERIAFPAILAAAAKLVT